MLCIAMGFYFIHEFIPTDSEIYVMNHINKRDGNYVFFIIVSLLIPDIFHDFLKYFERFFVGATN